MMIMMIIIIMMRARHSHVIAPVTRHSRMNESRAADQLQLSLAHGTNSNVRLELRPSYSRKSDNRHREVIVECARLASVWTR
jgi:hypothetical protein